jgi:HEAT repeat protein
MAVTMQDVLTWIDLDEIDYPAAAAELGAEALPLLEELAEGGDTMLASKAVYLATVISEPGSARIVERAAQHPDARVRVAAAAGLRNLAEEDAEPQLEGLLQDTDLGVRKVALTSAAAFGSPAMTARVQKLAEDDPEPAIRELASQAISGEPTGSAG